MTANILVMALVVTQQIAAPDTLPRPDVVMTVQGSTTLFRGNRVQILIRTDRDAYLTLYRVDTEGKVSVLFPSSPDSQRIWTPMVSRGVADPTGRLEHNTFMVHDYSGTGYLFVIASPTPFDYATMRDSSGWNIDGLIEGGDIKQWKASELMDSLQGPAVLTTDAPAKNMARGEAKGRRATTF